jgi:hypothetical protein
MPVAKKDIPDESQFVIKTVDDWPVYMDHAISRSESKITIDIAGWSTFKRLIVIDN